jgi:5-methylcytosine-specific restriction protein B
MVFKDKLFPLLQEFFYNDYAKIGLVLGDAFVDQTNINTGLFAKFKDGNDLAVEYDGKIIYTLKDPFKLDIKDFQSIYQ